MQITFWPMPIKMLNLRAKQCEMLLSRFRIHRVPFRFRYVTIQPAWSAFSFYNLMSIQIRFTIGFISEIMWNSFRFPCVSGMDRYQSDGIKWHHNHLSHTHSFSALSLCGIWIWNFALFFFLIRLFSAHLRSCLLLCILLIWKMNSPIICMYQMCRRHKISCALFINRINRVANFSYSLQLLLSYRA